MLAKISDEFASRNGNRGMIGRGRALNEAHEVGRADHVEIDVEHDVTTVIFGQTVDMLTRTTHRNGGWLSERARKSVRPAVSALIHDDNADGASRDGVFNFGLEWASPATDQRHRAGLEILEVDG